MSEASDEDVELLATFFGAVCLECQLTPDQLEAIVSEPGFGAHGRPNDWRAYVPVDIIAVWEAIPMEAAIIAFYMSHLRFLQEQPA